MSQIGPFWEGDHPLNSIEIDILTDDDLTGYTAATVTFIDGTGTPAALPITAAFDSADPPTLAFSIPHTLTLTEGLWKLVPILSSAGGGQLRLRSISMVIQADDGWHTIDSLRDAMGEDFTANDQQAWSLLQIAKMSVLAYAPELLEDALPPVNYVQAQLMQARNVLNAVKTDPAQGSDGDLFVIRPYPLDNFIRQMLRPKRGIPVVG